MIADANFPTISEDDVTSPPNGGVLVSSLATMTDLDVGDPQGIAIANTSATNGKWQFSLDAGLTWNDVGAVSETSALLLRSSDYVRFLPDGKNGNVINGLPDSINFRAWDQTGSTAGLQGTKVDTSVNGDNSAFSTGRVVFPDYCQDLNDAPVLNGANAFTGITEDQTANAGNLVSDLIAGQVTDVDVGAVQGIAVTGATAANGKWQYSIDAGVTWTDLPDCFANLRVAAGSRATACGSGPMARTATKATVSRRRQLRAWDQTSTIVTPGVLDQHGSMVSILRLQQHHAFSSATRTSYIHVTEVNDAPVLTGAANFTAITEDQTANAGNLVSDLIAGHVADVDIGAVQGIAVTGACRHER